MKKTLLHIFAAALLTGFFCSCTEDEIDTYKMEDSAVCFQTTSASFSLKGVTEEWTEIEIPVTFIGPVAPYDREFAVAVVTVDGNTAVEGHDFIIDEHKIEAQALDGCVRMRLKKFSEGTDYHKTTLAVQQNEHFKLGYPSYTKVTVEWSEQYVRPKEAVWRYWYLYFCHGYSRNLHQLIIETLGPEVEYYTGAASYVKQDPTLTMKMPTWWYEASRTVYQAVKAYDAAHPDAPLMHSSDYESYTSYKTAVGEGTKPETIPTIFETLETL